MGGKVDFLMRGRLDGEATPGGGNRRTVGGGEIGLEPHESLCPGCPDCLKGGVAVTAGGRSLPGEEWTWAREGVFAIGEEILSSEEFVTDGDVTVESVELSPL